MKKITIMILAGLLLLGLVGTVYAVGSSSSDTATLHMNVPASWFFSVTPHDTTLTAEPGMFKESTPSINLYVTSNMLWQRRVSWGNATQGANVISAADISGKSDVEGAIVNGAYLPRAAGTFSENLTFGYTLLAGSTLPPGNYDATITIEANQL